MENYVLQIGQNKVRNLIRKDLLKPVWMWKFIQTTDSNHELPIAASIRSRQFNSAAPNTASIADITLT